MASTDLRVAAQQALEAMSSFESGTNGLYEGEFAEEIAALKAALVEDAMQKFTDVNQELEAALAEPVQERDLAHEADMRRHAREQLRLDCMDEEESEHFCDTHCTWADHAPGCVMEERNFCPRCGKRSTDIHTCTPPAPLTDEVIADLWHQNGGFHHHFARAIERWLRGHA